jgi:hypothetical protein
LCVRGQSERQWAYGNLPLQQVPSDRGHFRPTRVRQATSSPIVKEVAVASVVAGLVRAMHRDSLHLGSKPSSVARQHRLKQCCMKPDHWCPSDPGHSTWARSVARCLGLVPCPQAPAAGPSGRRAYRASPGIDERTGDRAGPRTPQAVSRRRAPGYEPAPKVPLLWIFRTNCSFSRVRTGATTRETSAGEGHGCACRAHDQ